MKFCKRYKRFCTHIAAGGAHQAYMKANCAKSCKKLMVKRKSYNDTTISDSRRLNIMAKSSNLSLPKKNYAHFWTVRVKYERKYKPALLNFHDYLLGDQLKVNDIWEG